MSPVDLSVAPLSVTEQLIVDRPILTNRLWQNFLSWCLFKLFEKAHLGLDRRMDPEGKGPQGSYSMQDFLLSSEEEQLKFLLLLNPSHVSKTADKKQLWAVQLRRFLKVVAFFGEAAARLTLESKMLGREEQEPEAEQEQEEGEGEEKEEITSLKEIDLLNRYDYAFIIGDQNTRPRGTGTRG